MNAASKPAKAPAAVVRVGINGVAGRMGRQLLAAVIERQDCRVSAGLEAPGNPAVGVDLLLLAGHTDTHTDAVQSGAGAQSEKSSPLSVSDNMQSVCGELDVIIDFSVPDASMALLETIEALEQRKAVVIGTTGFSAEQKETIQRLSEKLPLVMASNYSVGVTLCLELLKTTAATLGDDYDVEVIEAHHRNKIDAPSGTALSMGEAVAGALGRDLADCAVYGRQGNTGVRSKTEIGFETIRAGDIIGDHTVLFAGEGERIEITHRATDRMAFARGAVRAANWLVDQPPGLYDMADVIGLRTLVNK